MASRTHHDSSHHHYLDPKILAQVEKGIKKAVRKLEQENEVTQATIVKEVYASDKFLQVR